MRRAWEALPTSLFGGEDGRLSARAAFVEVGLFGRLAGARRAGQSVDALVAMALSTPEVRRVKGHRAIIEARIAPLRRFAARAVLAGGSPGAAPGSAPAARPPEELEEDAESEPERAATVVRYERVRAQQDAIVAAMRHGSLGRGAADDRGALRLPAARQAHLPGQVPVPPLVLEAQRLGLHDLQDELTEQATRACPHDPWSWSQRGTALRRVSKLSEALAAYERSLVLGGDAAAKNGRADS